MDEAERKIYRRRSLRLPGYDDSQPGAYFVTVVTHGRACLFGDVVDGEMHLNDAGRVVVEVWNSLPGRFPGIDLRVATVMPNHFHGILGIYDVGGVSVGAIHELHAGGAALPRSGSEQARREARGCVRPPAGVRRGWGAFANEHQASERAHPQGEA